MQKKAIPLLISLMILALAGIICIQFLWIQKSISEKQELVDNKVIQAATNVDLQLSDYGAMAFFTARDSFDFTLTDSLIFLEQFDTNISHIQPGVPGALHSPPQMELQVVAAHHNSGDCLMISHTQVMNRLHQTDSIAIELEQIEYELMRLEEVRTVFDQIRCETDPLRSDFRLDSSKIDESLKNELALFDLDTHIVWQIYDTQDKQVIFQPASKTDFTYSVPLFKNDVIYPGRYLLQLSLPNNSELIWIDIRLMIFMSVVFIVIILTAFVFSIRLILKHKKISQIKSDFINNMTHEFKTPLASISLAADSIVHPNIIHDKKRIEEYVSIIQQEKSKLNQNVERILDVAALEKDCIHLPKEKIELGELIRETAKNLQHFIQSKNGSISLNLSQDVFIEGSTFHLNQALSNIIENGIKYSDQKPALSISLTKSETHAEISIQDNGIGMSSKQLARVFDSFYRAETGNIHNTKGFGLGLTYSRFIIEKMNGHIAINSELKKGTCVTIQFPLL